ncbi:sugar ABC transporter ATP-binding protein [Halorubrum sp. C191]|uniref:ABC transporter ATP-binding protein n=1 Tax=Halorubrum sp. C191 TaxID=1383842 RepID=UPI000C06ADDF|nr:ABC transporter ATP-binding protein [Halorubrum sp. C191]PHQ41593.1 sugar ABC transporter ATP-binding protein [Halorubrum sp. C191]
MADVTLNNATKQYPDGVIGAEEVNLEITDGEFLILVGPSGCGKTTTLEMIAGLQKPTGGEVLIGGEVMNDVPPQDRDLAMVFQDYALYPHKTVRGNMEFGLKYSTDLPEDEKERKVEEAAELLGISDLLDQKPEQLSGGQQQRVALGRAIVREPEVSLLDEPLSNLDAKLRTQMRAELQRLQSQLDVTMIYVTHDQTEAMTMGDRIAILNKGHVQQVGTPAEVYNQPENEFVAQFIGSPSMNIFDATVEGGTVQTEAFVMALDEVADRRDGEQIRFGIRPEDFIVSTDPDAGLTRATVTVVERLGDENLLHLEFLGQDVVARVSEGILPSNGDEVSIDFPPKQVYLFDESGGTFKFRTVKAEGSQRLNQNI